MRPRPVSKACPRCGQAAFKHVKPERWVAFALDRRCTGCGATYTSPTPVWAGLVFILIGVVMLLAGGFVVVANVLRAMADPPAPPDPIGVAFFGGMVVVGVLSIVHGARVLLRPGTV